MDKNQECQEAARSFEQLSLGSACQYDPLHENWENRSSHLLPKEEVHAKIITSYFGGVTMNDQNKKTSNFETFSNQGTNKRPTDFRPPQPKPKEGKK